jgi:hypothetical protein
MRSADFAPFSISSISQEEVLVLQQFADDPMDDQFA